MTGLANSYQSADPEITYPKGRSPNLKAAEKSFRE
jgi:hypothetical protein